MPSPQNKHASSSRTPPKPGSLWLLPKPTLGPKVHTTPSPRHPGHVRTSGGWLGSLGKPQRRGLWSREALGLHPHFSLKSSTFF